MSDAEDAADDLSSYTFSPSKLVKRERQYSLENEDDVDDGGNDGGDEDEDADDDDDSGDLLPPNAQRLRFRSVSDAQRPDELTDAPASEVESDTDTDTDNGDAAHSDGSSSSTGDATAEHVEQDIGDALRSLRQLFGNRGLHVKQHLLKTVGDRRPFDHVAAYFESAESPPPPQTAAAADADQLVDSDVEELDGTKRVPPATVGASHDSSIVFVHPLLELVKQVESSTTGPPLSQLQQLAIARQAMRLCDGLVGNTLHSLAKQHAVWSTAPVRQWPRTETGLSALSDALDHTVQRVPMDSNTHAACRADLKALIPDTGKDTEDT